MLHYTKLGQHTVNAVRLAEVLQVMVKHGLADLMRRAGIHERLPKQLLRGLKRRKEEATEPKTFGQQLCSAFSDLGPTFVKFGQVLSTREDIVGPDLARELSQLQDAVDPMPFETMAVVLEEELGAPVEQVFSTFDKTPVASASLSQVYHATLKTGEEVAVKVQRPGIAKIIESDLSLMRQIADWVKDRFNEMQWIDPPGIVNEFARSVRREMDFTIEAQVITEFRTNFAETAHVFIPSMYEAYTTQRVLTIDWVDGVRLDQLAEYEARHSDPKIVARRGCEIICEMIFEHRLFHADPHPGNVFLMQDNRIAFLDLGMAGHLEKADVAVMADLFLAIFQSDAQGCVDSMLALTTQGDLLKRDMLEHETAEFIAFEARTIISSGQVSRGLERSVEILQRYGLTLAPRFSLLLKALVTIETVGRSLDPCIDMVPIVQPYVERLIARRYHPKQILEEIQHNVKAVLKLGRQIPDDLGHLIKQLRKGKFQVKIHHEHLENLAKTIESSSKRTAVSMIIAALIIGSSMLITMESTISRLGVAGFVFAGLLGLILVVNMLWGK